MNIKQLIRILFRNKTFSLLNIIGLAIGLASAGLILLWIEDEVTFNDFPKQDTLYVVYQNQYYGDDIYSFPVAPTPLAAALKEGVAGIKNTTRYNDFDNNSLFSLNENKMFNEKAVFTDPSFFSMFDVEFLHGSPGSAFALPNSIVITEEMAEKFFGKTNPVGQLLKKDNKQDFHVTAVIKTPKKNSRFSYSCLIPFSQLIQTQIEGGFTDAETNWGSNWMTNYVELEPSANVEQVNQNIKNLLSQKQNSPDNKTELFLFSVKKTRLYGDIVNGKPTGSGFIKTINMFQWIAVIILLIACINFMNLSTARSQKRVLEVGVKKTFGAGRIQLIRQFLRESTIITVISIILALILIQALLPQFNTLTDKSLSLGLSNPVHWVAILLVGFICSITAGSYPAFYLSSFPPIDVLRKMKSAGGSAAWIRKGLVVFQFAASVVLIICTAFIYLQIQHAKNRSLGMEINQVVTISATQEIKQHYEPIRQELMATGLVNKTGLSSQLMIDMWNNGGGWNWLGKPKPVDPLIYGVDTSPDLLECLNIELISGHYFIPSEERRENHDIIINESLATIMGDEGRIGGRIWPGDQADNAFTIIGIVRNFVFNDMYKTKEEPAIFYNYGGTANFLFISLKPGEIQNGLNKIEQTLKRFDPSHPFEYRFMDDRFESKFKSQLLVGKLAGLFGLLAILISCLGLFGLTAFSAEQRTREIGIRKVLGASVRNILQLIGSDFMKLIIISFIIGIPIAWWIMHGWLQNYEYRIQMNWWIFAGAALVVSLIALLTVSLQAIKAATSDPVKAIKSE